MQDIIRLKRRDEKGDVVYLEASSNLIATLIREIPLAPWSDDGLGLNPEERESVDLVLKKFDDGVKRRAQRQGGADMEFHPEFWEFIKRMLFEYALRRRGRQLSLENWKAAISTYLKAFAVGLNPESLLDIAELLGRASLSNLAKLAIENAALFPAFAQSRSRFETDYTTLSAATIGAYVMGFEPQNGIYDPAFQNKLRTRLSSIR